MARKQKPTPKISDWLGLDWEEQDSEVPENEVWGKCDFCKGNIKVTEKYFFGMSPSHSQEPGMALFQACIRCVQEAGIKW